MWDDWDKPVWLLKFTPEEQQLIAMAREHLLHPVGEKTGHFSLKAYGVIGKLVQLLEERDRCHEDTSAPTPYSPTLRAASD